MLMAACTPPREKVPSTLHSATDTLLRQCHAHYAEARRLQKSGHYEAAINHFTQCIATEATSQPLCGSLAPIVTDALLQLMNTYQSAGKPEACADYLCLLRDSTATSLIRNHLMGDLYSILGYSLSRTERMSEAEEMTEKALATPLEHPTPDRLFRNYAYATAVFFSNPTRQQEVIHYAKEAIRQAHLSRNTSGMVYVYSMLGTLYRRSGNTEQAITEMLEAIDEAKSWHDTLAIVNTCNVLAEFYLYWDLLDYANAYTSEAIRFIHSSTNKNPMLFSQTFLLKGKSMEEAYPDSSLYYYHRAGEYCIHLPYNSGNVDLDLAIGTHFVTKGNDTQLDEGMTRLHRVMQQATPANRANACHVLAQGYFRTHRLHQGEAMLDSMYSLLHLAPSPTYIKNGYAFALNHYLQTGNVPQIARYAQALLDEQNQAKAIQVSRKLAETVVHTLMEKKQNEIKLEKMRMRNRELTILLIALIVSGLTLTALILLIRTLRRQRAREREFYKQMNTLLDDLEHERNKRNHAEDQLTEYLSYKRNQEIAEVCTPATFKNEGEEAFRERFETLYPGFLHNLRHKVLRISRKEEIICMLIILDQDPLDMEDTLGISHSSVIQARYRLRQKMGLDRNDSLDEAIKALI